MAARPLPMARRPSAKVGLRPTLKASPSSTMSCHHWKKRRPVSLSKTASVAVASLPLLLSIGGDTVEVLTFVNAASKLADTRAGLEIARTGAEMIAKQAGELSRALEQSAAK